jgi:hypothetical protein
VDPLGRSGLLEDPGDGRLFIESCQDHPLGARMLLAEGGEELGCLHMAHVVIDEENGDMLAGLVQVLEEVEGRVSRVGGEDPVGLGVAGGQVLPQLMEDLRVVVKSKDHG